MCIDQILIHLCKQYMHKHPWVPIGQLVTCWKFNTNQLTILSGVEPNHLQELSQIVGNKKKDDVVPQTITRDMFN